MNPIRLIILSLCTMILLGCTSIEGKNGYATVTVVTASSDDGGRVIRSIDGNSTGYLFHPKTVQILPGEHTVEVEFGCTSNCPGLPTKFVFIAEEGCIYRLPASGEGRVEYCEN